MSTGRALNLGPSVAGSGCYCSGGEQTIAGASYGPLSADDAPAGILKVILSQSCFFHIHTALAVKAVQGGLKLLVCDAGAQEVHDARTRRLRHMSDGHDWPGGLVYRSR